MMKTKQVVILVLFAALLLSATGLTAQANKDYVTTTSQSDVSKLPLTRVILYASGVGYFQREGTVTGSEEVEFSFKASEVNDLLKSLTVRDLDGGRVTGITYGSQDPVDKRLKSFAVNLSGNPGLSDILTQLRGEHVALAVPETVEGTVIGVEGMMDKEGVQLFYLNILTSGGLRSFPLRELKSIRFTDEGVNAEFRKALDVLAESHEVEKKPVRVGFSGNGSRRVSMGYITEAPAWKTSYRLVLSDDGKHYLQGWAIVENATDEDWRGVSLSLVSGRPVSFVMDLATPRYVQRPVVRQSTAAGPAPQTYDDTLLDKQKMVAPAQKSAAAPSAMRFAESLVDTVDGVYPEEMEEEYDDEVTTESLIAGVSGYGSIESAGSFVRYRIDVPVSLPRRESALFPLIDGDVEGKQVSVYDGTVDVKRPLLGVELVNSTDYSLLAGPITVFESGAYAGDALIEDLQPKGERLITYAVDMETEVAPSTAASAETIVSMTLAKGVMYLSKSARRGESYTVKNGSNRDKEIIIVRPRDTSWRLITPKDIPETTRNAYRFRMPVNAGATEVLRVEEERQLSQSFGLNNLSDAQLVYYSSEKTASPEIKKAFAAIVEKRAAIKDVAVKRQEAERQLQQLKDEQKRIRSNMDSIASSSDLYKRYMGMLEEQEDAIAKLLGSIDSYYLLEEERIRDLENFILSL